MTTTKHTPTPWLAYGTCIKAGLISIAHADLKPDDVYDMPLAKANADHIVACVNAHDALTARVAKLEMVLADCRDALDRRDNRNCYEDDALIHARAALAKVAP